MKKNILLSLLILLSFQVMSQEKGSYLTISGGMGPSGITYKMTDVVFADPKCEIKLGGQAALGYSYFFTKHFGLSVGVGFANYKTEGKWMGDFSQNYPFSLGNYTDNDFFPHTTDYELRVRTKNWVEIQSVKFLEIPLTINLQKKFGEKENFGLYLNAGAKFQFPVSAKYAVQDGVNKNDAKLNVSGYYEEKNLELGGLGNPDLSQHGFGQIHNPSERLTNANGNLNLKMNISLVGEAGILVSLSRRVDLSLGAFIDYGLLNMRKDKENTALFTGPETDYVSGAENFNVGNGITYNSVTQSKYVPKIGSISYGGKVGLRIKLGKLSQKEQPQALPQPCLPDTVIIEKQLPQQNPQALDSIKHLLNDLLIRLADKDNLVAIPTEKQVIEPTAKLEDKSLDFYPGVYPDAEMDILFKPIYFDLDKSILKPESIKDLNEKVVILKKYKDIKLIIFGNTCDIGNDAYNFKLGYRRAEVAKNYLIKSGIDESRLQISTMSRFEPELPNTNEPNRTHNRRDDFKPIFPRNK